MEHRRSWPWMMRRTGGAAARGGLRDHAATTREARSWNARNLLDGGARERCRAGADDRGRGRREARSRPWARPEGHAADVAAVANAADGAGTTRRRDDGSDDRAVDQPARHH